MSADGRGSLLHEKDGDFNPGWLVFLVFAGLGVALNVAAIVVAVAAPEKAWPLVVAAMVHTVLVMIVTAIIVVPIARAKLLANSRTLASGLSALGRIGGGYPGDPETMRDREHEVVAVPDDG